MPPGRRFLLVGADYVPPAVGGRESERLEPDEETSRTCSSRRPLLAV